MCFSFPPYFDHDAFMNHKMHVLDAPVPECKTIYITHLKTRPFQWRSTDPREAIGSHISRDGDHVIEMAMTMDGRDRNIGLVYRHNGTIETQHVLYNRSSYVC